jgi:hypothetical protein
MHLLNFSHPLDPTHLATIAELTGCAPDEIQLRHIPTQFDHEQSFIPQVVRLLDGLGFTASSWQSDPILINPPAYTLIAVTLLAELHGRMGYFPPHLRLKPEPGALPPRFVVAELVNLQAVRDAARHGRVSAIS